MSESSPLASENPYEAPLARPDIWVHPVTLAQIRQQFTAPAVVGVSVGNVGIYAGSRLFTDCRQVIGTLRDKAMESGEHACGPDPCGAKQAEASLTADNEPGPAAGQTADKDPSNKAESEKQ